MGTKNLAPVWSHKHNAKESLSNSWHNINFLGLEMAIIFSVLLNEYFYVQLYTLQAGFIHWILIWKQFTKNLFSAIFKAIGPQRQLSIFGEEKGISKICVANFSTIINKVKTWNTFTNIFVFEKLQDSDLRLLNNKIMKSSKMHRVRYNIQLS